MCGIFGALSWSLNGQEKDIVKELGIASVLRGHHSTGLISIHEHKRRFSVIHNKMVTTPFTFVRHPNNAVLFEGPNKKSVAALIGHNRFATVGAVERKNAHPFSFGKIIGVHNGTVNHKWGNEKHFETDSEALYDTLNREGLKAVVDGIGRSTYSAYALAYFDREEQTINLIRNDQRPLCFMNAGGVVFFASEAKMLDWVVSRNLRNGDITILKPYHHYQWRVGSRELKPTVTDMTPSYRSYLTGFWENGVWRDGNRSSNPFGGIRKSTSSTPVGGSAGGGAGSTRLTDATLFRNDGKVHVWNHQQNCWDIVSWMSPDDNKPRSETFSDIVRQLESKEFSSQDDIAAAYADCKQENPDQKIEDSFPRLKRFAGRNILTGQLEKKVAAKKLEVAIRNQPEEDDLENLFQDDDHNVVLRSELETALEHGCSECHESPDFDEVTTRQNTILGTVRKGDAGEYVFKCRYCLHGRKPTKH